MLRTSARVVVLLALLVTGPMLSARPEPTAEEVKAAKDAFAKLGAFHEARTNSKTKVIAHWFTFDKATDADMKKLPNPPFAFNLTLRHTQVTNAGLKELKALENLIGLSLAGPKITNAGLKELKTLKNLTSLSLISKMVTDAGLKELKGLTNLTTLSLASTLSTRPGMRIMNHATHPPRRSDPS